MAKRKYVQILKSTGFVNLVGDESLGMEPTDNDIVWIFDISKHPQNAEIAPYMKYNEDTATFYWPEPEQLPDPQPEPEQPDDLAALRAEISEVKSGLSEVKEILEEIKEAASR